MKILLVIGHSREKSLSHLLAKSFHENAHSNEVRTIDLATLNFDPLLREQTVLEKDLKNAQDLITWSEHIIFFFPIWWSSYPAVLKGFIDRTFLPGFAFSYEEGALFPKKLLLGKTSSLVITSDSPTFYRKYILNDPAVRSLKRDTLGFCGIKVKNVKYLGPVRGANQEKIRRWANDISMASKLSTL